MKILVTGGTGFLGRRVVDELNRRGHALRLLVRPTSSRERFPEGVEFAEGDVVDEPSLRRAAEGVDAVLHGAALVKIMAPAKAFDAVNIGGLENVLRAVESAGVGRLVYVSSFMALGPTEGAPGGVLDETAPIEDRDWINDYERTKALADRRARKAIAAGIPLSVVYPGVIYGPGELTEGNIVLRHVLDLAHGRLPGLIGRPERRWNYSYVEDVASGTADVLEHAPTGERYVVAGDNITQSELYELVGEYGQVRIPRLRFPDAVAKLAGTTMKGWARLTGGVPRLTPDLVEVYRHDWAYSSAKAERELGYRWRSAADGFRTAIEWLKTTESWPK